MKKILSLILIIMLFMSLTACKSELFQHMIIKGFGVDMDGEDYKLTVRYASLDEEKPEAVFSVTGKTVYDAMSKISINSGMNPLYSSASYIVYGKDVAEKGLDTAMDFFVRYFKAKPIIKLFIAENTAEEILTAKKDEKLIDSNMIEESTGNEQNKGKTVSSTVMNFISEVKSESGASLVPLIAFENDNFKSTKTAIFNDYKLTEVLDEDETKGYLASTGSLKFSSIIIDDTVSLEVQKISSKISETIEKGKPSFTIDLKVSAIISAIPFTTDTIDFEYLEKEASTIIEKYVEKSVEILKESNSDYFGFSNTLYLKEKDYWQKNSESFELSDVDINLKVKTKLIRTGEEDN